MVVQGGFKRAGGFEQPVQILSGGATSETHCVGTAGLAASQAALRSGRHVGHVDQFATEPVFIIELK